MIEKITINKHSSIRVQGSQVLYFDPYGIEEEPHDADVIFITHDHHDHFEPESIEKIARDDTLLVMPRSCLNAWSESGLISTQMVQMDPGQSLDIFGLLIETIPAYNLRRPFHTRRHEWVGYVVTLDHRRIYVAGDTDLTEEAKEVRCDIAFVPVGGKYTMNAEKAAELINIIRPDIAVPTHYGSVVGKPGDGRLFKEYVDEDIIVPLLIRHASEQAAPSEPEAEAAETDEQEAAAPVEQEAPEEIPVEAEVPAEEEAVDEDGFDEEYAGEPAEELELESIEKPDEESGEYADAYGEFEDIGRNEEEY